MPELPKNAKYINHRNECFDWGTFGWSITTKKVDAGRYRFIIFLNSSVRGPFVPPYWPVSFHPHLPCQQHCQLNRCHFMQADTAAKRGLLQAIHGAGLVSMCGPIMLEIGMQASVHWTSIYTQRLGPKVKLVGSTINCQPVYFHNDPSKELRQNPHVQSYVTATDQVTHMLSVCTASRGVRSNGGC